MSKRRTPKELRFPICPHGKVQFNTEKAAQIAEKFADVVTTDRSPSTF